MAASGRIAFIALIPLLAACGDEPPAPTTAASPAAAAASEAAPAATAPAGGTADEAAPAVAQVACPPSVQERAGPDIIGLKLGMKRDEALNVVLCHNGAADVAYEDRWLQLETHGHKLEKQSFTATVGQKKDCRYNDVQCILGDPWERVDERIIVASPGTAGNETVVGVWRTQVFPEGQMIAFDDALAALSQKYGEPQFQGEQGSGRNVWRMVRWAKDTTGQPFSESNPQFRQCAHAVNPDGQHGQSWSAGCGMTIGAMMKAAPLNPDLVAEMRVGMMDQQALYDYGEALQAQLDEMHAGAREQQLDAAKKAAGDIKL